MSYVVRPARESDFEAVTSLLAELGRPAVPAAEAAAARAVYRRHLERGDTASLVAEVGGGVVGFCSLEFRDRLNHVESQAWIPDLIVTASSRGRGVGRALLAAACEEARARRCWSVTLESGHQRLEAHRLYDSAGMEHAGRYYLLRLS